MGKKNWGVLDVGEGELKMTKEIRLLGYRIDTERTWEGHVEYWTERGIGVRRNVSNVSRRFGSQGGIGPWECLRMIRGVYLPTVCYGMEFVSKESKRVKKLQIAINDTIRSILRAPLKYANKILYAETGIEPIEMMCRAAERRGYARHVKYEYGKEAPWYGIIAEGWKDERIRKTIDKSDSVRKTKPKILIEKDKEKAIKTHDENWDKKKNDELWVYTDGSKRENEGAISWILLEGDGLVEEENGMKVPGTWSITKMEICAMAMAMRDMERWGKKKIRLFSDSMSGIKMIEDMKNEGESAPLWDRMVKVLNEWEEVTIEWIPGHKGIIGNQRADEIAKSMRNRRLDIKGRWIEMDYEENSKTSIRSWMEEEWMEWHKKGGHEYYERTPRKPKHLKDMTRLDCYVMMRLRSGTDKKGHEACKNYEFRHHLSLCERFSKNRPELHTLYDDKEIDKWKTWWRSNEYLGMGIPTNTTSHDDVRIMYGNPFDSTITIERNGKTITEDVGKSICGKCDKPHSGKCMQRKAKMRIGRWFFVDEDRMECEMCNGKFGGGSTSRPGGSGLLKHIQTRKDSCGKEWEKEYWEEKMAKWTDWDKEFQMGLVLKWIELNWKKRRECEICGKSYKDPDGIRKHVRREQGCMKGVADVMKKFPLGKAEEDC